MTQPCTLQDANAGKETWTVALVYEDLAARDHGLAVCDRLIARLWKDVQFRFDGWRFELLRDPGISADAAVVMAEADLVVFSFSSCRMLPEELGWWNEVWLKLRARRPGAMVMLRMGAREMVSSRDAEFQLRELARRAGIDFALSAGDLLLGDDLPDSIDAFTRRAEKVTSILDGILNDPKLRPVPSQWRPAR